MEKHHGKIVERVVRRTNMSLSELSKHLGVNRRSIYNWFNLPQIKPEIVYRLGRVIQHDFSHEFPELFSSEDFKVAPDQNGRSTSRNVAAYEGNEDIWKNKYIDLLEKFNRSMKQELDASA